MPFQTPTTGALLTRPAPAANRSYSLTGEQANIVAAAHAGSTVVAEALAGTGKTSTLVAMAESFPNRPTTYLAFNKSVQLEAARRFPTWVDVRTAHSIAFQTTGRAYSHRLPGNGGRRVSAQQMAKTMKVRAASLDTGTLNPVVLTRMAQATVAAFMKTADPEITDQHIPSRVFANHAPNEIAQVVVPIARKIWDDLSSTTGQFFFTHDVYLKLWQLQGAIIPSDLIMFDEAQDADPVIASIVARQNGQKVYVGDRNQAIYGWRGAIDALSRVEGATRLPLTKSFRFGPAIAEQANLWLEQLGSKLQVVGHDPVGSEVVAPGTLPIPRAILCRGNGTALGWVLAFHERGVPVALAPGDKTAGKDMERFAWAAKDLMNGEGTDHPDLVGFTDWRQLVTFVEEEENTDDLKRMVGIINRIGVSGVIDAVKKLVPEEKATITVSTAHKAKGLEWDSVKVADDFALSDKDDEAEEKELREMRMLNYVTVTRAKKILDPGPLGEAWAWDR